jgi:hypothetical protein
VIAERFADQMSRDASTEGPKIEIPADDDFEPTVFEEVPAPPLEDALSALDEGTGSTSSESVVPPPMPRETETMERAPVASGRRSEPGPVRHGPRVRDSERWTVPARALAGAPATGSNDWCGADEDDASVRDRGEVSGGDEGTSIDGVSAAAPLLGVAEGNFVAGEIDVPTPPPERDPPSLELTADPDTGLRTRPIERR